MIIYVVPALIGVFWGAPLIARELETGTHRLAWNQSVTRTRWLATKLVIVGAAAAVTVGLLSWAVTSWAHHIDDATGDRITPELFTAPEASSRSATRSSRSPSASPSACSSAAPSPRWQPPSPSTSSPLIRCRSGSGNTWYPPATSSTRWTFHHWTQLIDQCGDSAMTVVGSDNLPDAWVLSNQTITDTGEVFTGPADPQYCGLDCQLPSLRGMGRQPRPAPRTHLPSRQPLLAPPMGRNRHPPRRRRYCSPGSASGGPAGA